MKIIKKFIYKTRKRYFLLGNLFILYLILNNIWFSEAKFKLWNINKSHKIKNDDQILNFNIYKSIFGNYNESINLNNKLISTIDSYNRIYQEKDTLQSICENSSLNLLKRESINSSEFTNEMLNLRNSINNWYENIQYLDQSNEIKNFKQLILFMEFIDTKMILINFCINLFNNINLEKNINNNENDHINNKKSICMKLNKEIQDQFSKNISNNFSKYIFDNNLQLYDIFQSLIKSLNNDLNIKINQVDKYNKLFGFILLFNKYKYHLKNYNELNKYIFLNNTISNDDLESIQNIKLSNIIFEVQEYIPENTIFVTSPLSKLILKQLLISKQLLIQLSKSQKYQYIYLPLKKKLIFMIKLIGNKITLYEKNYIKLNEILTYIANINYQFDKNLYNLCKYKFYQNDNLIMNINQYNLTKINDLYSSDLKLFFIKNNKSLNNPFSIGNRSNKGLPYLPELNNETNNYFNDNFSLNNIYKLIQIINIASDEFNNIKDYIHNSTNDMLNSLEKIKFTNQVYKEIIDSSKDENSVPNSIYSYSYILSLHINMLIKQASLNIKKLNKNNSKLNYFNNKINYINKENKDQLKLEIDEAIKNVIETISSLNQIVNERTKTCGLKNIKTKFPNIKNKLKKQVQIPLIKIENYILYLKKSSEDSIKDMIIIEKKIHSNIKNLQNFISKDKSDQYVFNFKKYLKPLSLIMKCSVISELSKEYIQCKEIISQAKSLLDDINNQINNHKIKIKNKTNSIDKSSNIIESLIKRWVSHLNWIKNIPKLCNNQLSLINKIDSDARMILG